MKILKFLISNFPKALYARSNNPLHLDQRPIDLLLNSVKNPSILFLLRKLDNSRIQSEEGLEGLEFKDMAIEKVGKKYRQDCIAIVDQEFLKTPIIPDLGNIVKQYLYSAPVTKTTSVGAQFTREDNLPDFGEAWEDPKGNIWSAGIKDKDGNLIRMTQSEAKEFCEAIGEQLPSKFSYFELNNLKGFEILADMDQGDYWTSDVEWGGNKNYHGIYNSTSHDTKSYGTDGFGPGLHYVRCLKT